MERQELLQPVGGHPTSLGYGVNSSGWVAGMSRTYLGSGLGFLQEPTLWIGANGMQLPAPPGYTKEYALDVDDSGVVIGYFLNAGPGFPAVGVVWVDFQVFKTSEIVVRGSPVVGEMKELNSVGQMLSMGSAKILTPVNKPATDLNGDCAVDGSDLMKLLAEWGPREWSFADLNHDGVVNGADLAQVLGNWTGSK